MDISPHPRRRAIAHVLGVCVLLLVAMVAAVNLAVPKLAASSLHPTSSQLLWIVDGYVLAFGCLLIPAGALGDRLGRKRALLYGLAIVATGCALSALAPTVGLLVAGRVLAGAGAALVMPATLSITLAVHAPAERPGAVARWTMFTGVGGAAGNLLGGVVLQWLPWWALFAAAVPLVVALALLVARLAPQTPRHDAALDVAGSALLSGAMVALLYAIIEGPSRGWGSGAVLGAFAAAALLLAAFVAWQLRAAHPLLDPRAFASAPLRAGTLGVGATFFGLFALFFVNAQYLQYAKGFSPLGTGIAVGPLALGMIVASRASVGLAARLGARTVVATGLTLIAIGLVLLSFAGASTPYALYACFLVVMSVGMGFAAPSLSHAILSSLPPERAGMGAGLNSAARELGSALGVAVLGTLLAGRFVDALPASASGARSVGEALRVAPAADHAAVVSAFTHAMDDGYRVVAIVLVAASVVVLAWMRAPRAAARSERAALAD